MIKISYPLFFGLALVTTAYSMELTVKKNKRPSLTRKHSKKSFSSPAINDYKEVKEHPLIFATRSKDHNLIKFYLSDPYSDLNSQDLELNTALHHAAINEDNVTIKLFLHDPRIDASIKNINHRTARDLVDTSKIQDLIDKAKVNNPSLQKLEDLGHSNVIKHLKNVESAMEFIELLNQKDHLFSLRSIIFARATLDIITTQECNTIMTECKKTLREIYQKRLITPDLMATTIQNIKQKIQSIENQQCDDDRDLPPSAQFPLYATDDFILKMIYFRLNLHETNNTWVK